MIKPVRNSKPSCYNLRIKKNPQTSVLYQTQVHTAHLLLLAPLNGCQKSKHREDVYESSTSLQLFSCQGLPDPVVVLAD